jgi:hypothetical protein
MKELSMSIQDVLWRLKATSAGPSPPTLIMFIGIFIGVIAGPLMLFVVGGDAPVTSGYPDLRWLFIAISLLLLVGIGVGLLMFRRDPNTIKEISVSPNYG